MLEPQLELRPHQKGIAPALLFEQVKNTAPYLFDSSEPEWNERVRKSGKLTRHIQLIQNLNFDQNFDPIKYFELCLAVHHVTVATPVPTDVDNHIRFKLWDPELTQNELIDFAQLVLESRHWDPTFLSARWIRSPLTGNLLDGHSGEWFSTAAAAYCAVRKRIPELAKLIQQEILDEMILEASVFRDFIRLKDGIQVLKSCAQIAHNLGDLDRVMEQWKLPIDDPLRSATFEAGHKNLGGKLSDLYLSGIIYKKFMALENHRHFAIRAIRCLRKSPDFLVPIGPFFDDWGLQIAKTKKLTAKEKGLVIEGLVDGYERFEKDAKGSPVPVGYLRALSSLIEHFPGGLSEVLLVLPAKTGRTIKAGAIRAMCGVSQQRFEEPLAKSAIKWALNPA